ncbi:MAG: undecaprenyl-diphosphate phosphatase [Gammaproteobacteria bacterium]|nr:undecaprenyl-diphosphate phosphatase [Gammaproteobacteria bacterium]
MSELQAIWLGFVQGLTEFLPVSSSGHLVMAQELLGGRLQSGLVFEVALHVATLFAIVIFYRSRIGVLVVQALRFEAGAWRYIGKLVVATLPAVVVGLGLKDLIEGQFQTPAVSGVCLLLTGVILWTTRYTIPRAHLDEPGWLAAFLIGCAQAFAILPGISRSGTTVTVALALGVRAEKAAEFSFLMGIIAISGAAVLMLPDIESMPHELLPAIGLGGLAALISGVAAIWLFIRLLRRQSFHVFSFYTWGVGVLFLLWLSLRAA